MSIILQSDNNSIRLTQSEGFVKLKQEINNIDLNQANNGIELIQTKGSNFDLATDENRIKFTQTNLRGLPGAPGAQGEKGDKGDKGDQGEQGIPGVDGDKNYTQTFSPTDNLIVTHNLNKYPSVDIINSAGDEVIGNVNYLSLNTIIISFSAAFGGRITCN